MRVVNTNKCSFCSDEIDFLEHFFFRCTTIANFWKYIENFLRVELGKPIIIREKEALFGFQRGYSELELRRINHLILIGKMCISITKKVAKPTPIIALFEYHLRLRGLTHS